MKVRNQYDSFSIIVKESRIETFPFSDIMKHTRLFLSLHQLDSNWNSEWQIWVNVLQTNYVNHSFLNCAFL